MASEAAPRRFRLWVSGCCHVGTDLRRARRESLADAIRHGERGGDKGGPPFEWDIALHLGDFSGTQTPPDDAEGRKVVRQFAALRTHRREQFYCLVGNHDASGADEPTQWWFLHTSQHAPQGWYAPAERTLPLSKPFALD